jgi:hypothetical protein
MHFIHYIGALVGIAAIIWPIYLNFVLHVSCISFFSFEMAQRKIKQRKKSDLPQEYRLISLEQRSKLKEMLQLS